MFQLQSKTSIRRYYGLIYQLHTRSTIWKKVMAVEVGEEWGGDKSVEHIRSNHPLVKNDE